MSFDTAIGVLPGQRVTGVAANGLPYYTHQTLNTAFGTLAMVANSLIVTPFLCPKLLTVAGAALRVTTTGTATLARLGIYKDNGSFFPDGLLADFGTVAIGTTGVKEITGLSQQLEANRLYWLATLLDGTVTLNATGIAAIVNALGLDPFTSQAGVGQVSVAQAFGALPNPFTGGGVYGVSTIRHMFLRF